MAVESGSIFICLTIVVGSLNDRPHGTYIFNHCIPLHEVHYNWILLIMIFKLNVYYKFEMFINCH